MEDKIKMTVSETGEEVEFYIVEQTRINNTNYILVTEEDENTEEAEAYILKDLSSDSDAEAVYKFVEEDEELDYVSKIFAEILDDIDLDK
jgi:uncharacterized protein YrzB (UPF0473 family)